MNCFTRTKAFLHLENSIPKANGMIRFIEDLNTWLKMIQKRLNNYLQEGCRYLFNADLENFTHQVSFEKLIKLFQTKTLS